MGQINKGTLETKKGAEAPFDSDDVNGTSCGECEMERVEGIEPLMDKSRSKSCRCVGSIAHSPPKIIALTPFNFQCSHVTTE